MRPTEPKCPYCRTEISTEDRLGDIEYAQAEIAVCNKNVERCLKKMKDADERRRQLKRFKTDEQVKQERAELDLRAKRYASRILLADCDASLLENQLEDIQRTALPQQWGGYYLEKGEDGRLVSKQYSKCPSY
jgi:hypothetical protein